MMTSIEGAEAIKKFVASVAPDEQVAGRLTAEERCQALIKLANQHGANLDVSIISSVYFWGNQGYFDHEFARGIWGVEVQESGLARWEEMLAELALVDGMYERLDFIEASLIRPQDRISS